MTVHENDGARKGQEVFVPELITTSTSSLHIFISRYTRIGVCVGGAPELTRAWLSQVARNVLLLDRTFEIGLLFVMSLGD